MIVTVVSTNQELTVTVHMDLKRWCVRVIGELTLSCYSIVGWADRHRLSRGSENTVGRSWSLELFSQGVL